MSSLGLFLSRNNFDFEYCEPMFERVLITVNGVEKRGTSLYISSKNGSRFPILVFTDYDDVYVLVNTGTGTPNKAFFITNRIVYSIEALWELIGLPPDGDDNLEDHMDAISEKTGWRIVDCKSLAIQRDEVFLEYETGE